MVATLVVLHAFGLIVLSAAALAFVLSSVQERESRAATIAGVLACGLLLLAAGLLGSWRVGWLDDMFARVAVWRTERIKLLEEDIGQPGLLAELAASRFVERFANARKAPGQRPLASKRLKSALNQQDLQVAHVEPEDNTVGGYGGSRILVCKAHFDASLV